MRIFHSLSRKSSRSNHRVKNTIRLILFFIAVVGLFLFLFPITVSSERVNLGESRVGVPFRSNLVIRNYGLREVEIVQGKTSCLCTTTDLRGVKLSPFRSVSIPLQVNTSNLSGPISESVVFEVNHGAKRVHQIILEGKVLRSINVENSTRNLGVIPVDELSKPIQVQLRVEKDSPGISLIEVDHAEPPLAAKISSFSGSEGVLELDLSNFSIGAFTKKISLNGRNSEGNFAFSVSLTVIGVVTGRWSSDKTLLTYSEESLKGEPLSFTVNCPRTVKAESLSILLTPEKLAEVMSVDLREFPKVSIYPKGKDTLRKSNILGRLVIASIEGKNESVEIPIVFLASQKSKEVLSP